MLTKGSMTMFDGQFWAGTFSNVFAKQTSGFCTTVEDRLLPTFDSLEAEADQVADDEWQRLGQSVGSEDTDMADLAERATEAGVAYYMSMESVRQTLINLSVAALYHLFEQQLLFFYRRQVLHPREENDRDLIKIKVLKEKLASAGVDLEGLASWGKIEELRVVANTVKHAEGSSAEKLRDLRPDLFFDSHLRGSSGFESSSQSHVYLPLAGEDIFLSIADLKHYCAALHEFWQELAGAIQ